MPSYVDPELRESRDGPLASIAHDTHPFIAIVMVIMREKTDPPVCPLLPWVNPEVSRTGGFYEHGEGPYPPGMGPRHAPRVGTAAR